MKRYINLLLVVVAMLIFVACNRGPGYLYVDNQSDDPKPSFIESDDDNDAYTKAFTSYSTARFYPVFSEFEKTHRYIAENDGAEACEGDDGEMVAPADDSEGGAVISTGDDVTSIDGMGSEPMYEELLKINKPNFVLYKLNNGDARNAAKDFVDRKISYEEFQKKVQGEDAVNVIDLYDKNFDACANIDRRVFDDMLAKLRKAIAQIDKEALQRKAEAAKQ